MNLARVVYVICILLFSCHSLEASETGYKEFSSCDDPNYAGYINARLAFYDKLAIEDYEETKNPSFETLSYFKKYTYLHKNTINSARFDNKDIAMTHIESYMQKNFGLFGNSDGYHRTNIARGWLALAAKNEQKAIDFLMASTSIPFPTSAVLASFGPDMTLLRELYRRGHTQAALDYLEAVQTFWNTEIALKKIKIWKKMIAVDCPAQFQFYDTTNFKKLNLSL